MLQTIGVCELKNQTSSIMRQVREKDTAYVITRYGLPVALLRPIDSQDIKALPEQDAAAAWQSLQKAGLLLAKSKRRKKSALEILEKIREEESQWPL